VTTALLTDRILTVLAQPEWRADPPGSGVIAEVLGEPRRDVLNALYLLEAVGKVTDAGGNPHTSRAGWTLAGPSWADPETDPTRIDWPARQSAAAIPFDVVDGRPVNPHAPTGVRYGRNELGHWGEAQAADAIVTATTTSGQRWLLLIERGDGHGWALPGGMVDPDEDPYATAERELREETGLRLPERVLREHWMPRYVPDPRASDESWIVTRPMCADLTGYGEYAVIDETALPTVAGGDDANSAEWWPANSYDDLIAELRRCYPHHRVFAAHEQLLRDVLDGPGEAEMLVQTSIDDELSDYTDEQLRAAARRFLQLREAIRMTMANLDDWEAAGEQVSVEQLRAYLDHLTEATRGVCDLCGRVIFAPHTTTDLPARAWWHPRRWWNAAADAVTGLRYGGLRIAHSSCTRRHH
jgi:8-oxo-dGTP pyrophosphatase MutT (NUDIX family)